MKICELTPLEIEKWYAVAVGEIGIPPTDFYQMTEDELLWAYKGYRQRQEDMANIILLAMLRAQTAHQNEPFEFVNKDCIIGNLEERKNTFITLNIEEG